MSKILIACEESQVVTSSFRELGIEAYSCDILETSGEHPEWHIKEDVSSIINQRWDMIIAFPPCTDICSSGARWFPEKIKDGRQQKAIDFFLKFTQTKCTYVAIENPIGIMSNLHRKPNQIIQPWQFGHGETKATCLWLQNLPNLKPTNIVKGRDNRIHKLSPSKNRSKLRSKTYKGIAKAMAEQWSKVLKDG
jgi:site-specific DNA-cytosine methylase